MNTTAAYIIPPFQFSEIQSVDITEKLKHEDVVDLFLSLYFNLIENLNKPTNKFDLICVFYSVDKNLLTQEFQDLRIEFIDFNNPNKVLDSFSEKYFSRYKNNIIIKSNLMGINSEEVDRLINLLNIDDETLLVSKDSRGEIILLGFNRYSDKIFNDLIKSKFKYDEFLYLLTPTTHFVQIGNEYLSINDLSDFKELYLDLSKKKSIEYCSQNMHERFTNLFIEYKDLLK